MQGEIEADDKKGRWESDETTESMLRRERLRGESNPPGQTVQQIRKNCRSGRCRPILQPRPFLPNLEMVRISSPVVLLSFRFSPLDYSC